MRQKILHTVRFLSLPGVALTASLLSGCFASPQMRMSEPADSAEFAGLTVYLHPFEEAIGTAGSQAKNQKENSDASDSSADNKTSYASELNELIVDSLPALDYKIGPLDMVQVVVWEHPELTSPMGEYQPAGQKVTTDGKLFYPYAGEIVVEGMTAQELREEITKRLSDKILTNPQVDVRVTGYNSLKAFVSGEVTKPGYVALKEEPLTLPTALAEVGGLTQRADASQIQLRRGDKTYTIDYYSAFRTNLPLDRIILKPDDQLWVPSTEMQKVYVLGEVVKNSAVGLRAGQLSLVDALASAGGLQVTTASAASIYVIRNTNESQIDVYHLNAKNALALAMADRFTLRPRDIVYVDASGLATWNRLVSQILPTVQTIYYGVLTGKNFDQWQQTWGDR